MRKLTQICKVFVWLVLVNSCTTREALTPLVTFYNDNALLPQVSLVTSDSISLGIEYWPDMRPERKQRSKSSSGKNHAVVLFNLKPETAYSYRVIDVNRRPLTDALSFVTGPVPKGVLEVSKEKIDTTLFNGYILIRRYFRSGADVIIDNEGDVVWYNLYDHAVRRPFSWTKSNTILSIYDSAYIVETDLKGNRILDLDLEKHGIPNKIHHEVLFAHDGKDVVTLTLDSARYNLTRFGGGTNEYLRADGILVVSKEGEIKWNWNVLNVANPLVSEDISNLKESWGHANSIALHKDGNYLISFRNFNQIWKISARDGSVVWRFGVKGDFTIPQESEFIGQHSIHYNQRGELMLFDNGSHKMRPRSRILAFVLDEQKMEAKTIVNISLPEELTSFRMSSAELIGDGLYLVCTTRKDCRIAIVNEAGDVLWKVVGDNASYRAVYIQDPFKNE